MGSEGEDEEGFLALLKKIWSALVNYGASYFAVAFAFLALDVAVASKAVKDPTNWVATFNVDVWGASAPHISRMLKACAGVAVVSFMMELACILMNFGGVYKLLKVFALVNAVVHVVVTLPTVITGFSLGGSLMNVYTAKETWKIHSPLFDSYMKYSELIEKMKDPFWKPSIRDNDTTAKAFVSFQEEIELIQQAYACCGVNSTNDWQRMNFSKISVKELDVWPVPLLWWIECTPHDIEFESKIAVSDNTENENETKLTDRGDLEIDLSVSGCDVPFSCCAHDHNGGCHEKAATHRKEPCKLAKLIILIRCIMYACGLLLGTAVFGGIGSIFFYRSAIKGTEKQNRYRQWMTMTGQDMMDDDD